MLIWFGHLVVSALALFLTAAIVPGIKVDGFGSAIVAAFVLGIANILIWPFLVLITLPLNILTLGLFTFVVNAMILKICAGVLRHFHVGSWLAAIFGAIVLSIANTILHRFLI